MNVTITHARDGAMHVRSACGQIDERVEPRVDFTAEGAMLLEVRVYRNPTVTRRS